ncbi:MAG: hypothetical protein ACI955_001764 [Zhongshania sp.]|jgi:hypothetical protein
MESLPSLFNNGKVNAMSLPHIQAIGLALDQAELKELD